ncbi:MAG: diguanylate cyclase [Acidobacteria bacterium]|nr:diguanylate cyclase [Acidobacteriota bacterium]
MPRVRKAIRRAKALTIPQGRKPGGTAPDQWADEPFAARLYVSLIVSIGFALAATALRLARFERPVLLAVVLALSSLASTIKIRLPLTRGGSTMSLSYAVNFASLLLLGPLETTLVVLASGWIQCTFRVPARNPVYRILFSIACLCISVQGAGFVFDWVASGRTDLVYGVLNPIAAAATVYYFLNTAIVAAAIAVSNGDSIINVWHQNFLWSAPSYFIGAAVAGVTAAAVNRGSFWGVLVGLPLYLTYRSYRVYMTRLEEEQRQVQQMSDVHLATVEALALAVEAKDQTSQKQMRRIQICAAGLGRAAGLSSEELRALKTAALLHDIGNLAVPEHILSKPGSLTPEEFQRVKSHARIGAHIIQSVPFPSPVADHFSALLAERPYRAAHSYEEAIRILRSEAGTALDPVLVDIFMALLPDFERQLTEEQRELVVSKPDGNADALADIAGAHREERILFDIAQALGLSLSLGDMMGLIASKLDDLVPFGSCGLFLSDQEQQRVYCRYAAGPHANAIRRVGTRTIDKLFEVLPQSDADARGEPILDLLGCALRLPDQTTGAIIVYDTMAHRYTVDHRRIYERVAKQAAPAIYNSLMFERAQEESLTDPLTNLPNRRYLTEHFHRLVASAARTRRRLAVLQMDLDRFKQINEGYGYHVGDRVLCQVAVALRSFVRPGDLCVRHVGDEFVIVLANGEPGEAQQRAQELQDMVGAIRFEVQPGMVVPLSASVGAAVYPEDGLKSEELLETADARMYRQKVAHRARLRGAVAQPDPVALRME